MDPLHATIEEFAAEGYTHVEANCPRCRVIRLRAIDQLPKIAMGLTPRWLAHAKQAGGEEVPFACDRLHVLLMRKMRGRVFE